ncbi:DNA polymerase IV [Raineyella sp.]|uniref:DNA polymerase IV n=1 Tax=Raineyella sp. TaxID=1911550 RepID=UPI002B2067D0|nr:DNA polymerase IV [Raineyella sp.]MEA5153222.1 DNA polymerase IV [Raineyella sp.]
MRRQASIMHLDLDAFFASVEQRDKPSLRGKPVIVGGLGQRGVVATASYEARTYGVHSAMPMHEARRLCPNAAFLAGRFGAYRTASRIVMAILEDLSPLVEPLSLDEAFVDLAAAREPLDLSDEGIRAVAVRAKAEVAERTGGLTCSVGLGSSKFIAKLASELDKPDGIHLVVPGTEIETIAPLSVRVIPGVGPATFDRLSRLGVATVADLQRRSEHELVRELGRAHGTALHALAFARDDREVSPDRDRKSISVEDTFETDLAGRDEMVARIVRDARLVAQRMKATGVFARTVTLKVRLHDFTTWTRSRTLEGATDSAEVVATEATDLLAGLALDQGVRLLGVGVSGLTTVAQDRLFEAREDHEEIVPGGAEGQGRAAVDVAGSGAGDRTGSGSGAGDRTGSGAAGSAGSGVPEGDATETLERRIPRWLPGADVVHDEMGPGWIWGTGLGRVTVRFETAGTGPGPVRTYDLGDPALHLV